jgi:phage/plasmid-like protein (TIGR03299 family)
MGHDISEVMVDGKLIAEAMYSNSPAWHRLGDIFDLGGSQGPDSEKAMELSHTGWEVAIQKLFLGDGSEVEGRFATVRQDTGKTLGVVGSRYTILQNKDAFAFLDSLQQDGIMRYESAFALAGGARVCLLARLPSVDIIAEGDVSLRYILFENTHDGSGAIACMPTEVRAVCANTVALAYRMGKGMVFNIRHCGDMAIKMHRAKQYLSQFDAAFDLFRDQGRILATRRFSPVDLEQYLEGLFPTPVANGKKKLRGITIRKATVASIRDRYNRRNRELPSVQGSWWALFNAVTEYVDHDSQTRGANDRAKAENRFASVTSGLKAGLKDRAFSLALDMAGVVTSAAA